MKAIRIDGQTPGGKRTLLKDALPLNTPYIVQIFPVYACNFSCNYCLHSVPGEKRSFVSETTMLSYEMYKKTIDDLAKFPSKVKMLRFAGTGEPLLHKDIVNMIKYAVDKNVADTIDIVTNGSLLTHQLSEALIKVGLSKLRISIQGVTNEKYKETMGKKFDLNKLIDQIAYFYHTKEKQKSNTQLYIKVIDCALDEGQEEKFFDMFGDICDVIAIEHLLPAVSQINYSKLSDKTGALTQNGNEIINAQICPQPFYMMQINPDGNVVPCCAMGTACILGNIQTETLSDIWNGEKLRRFRSNQLELNRKLYPLCRECEQFKYSMFKEDYLDDDRIRLLDFFRE